MISLTTTLTNTVIVDESVHKLHKKRQRQRNRKLKQDSLDRLLGKIPFHLSPMNFKEGQEKHNEVQNWILTITELPNLFQPITNMSDLLSEIKVKKWLSCLHSNSKNIVQNVSSLNEHVADNNQMGKCVVDYLFWRFIPNICRPDFSTLNSDITSSTFLAQEVVRQKKFEKKLNKQLESNAISAEEMEAALVKHRRKARRKSKLPSAETVDGLNSDVDSTLTLNNSCSGSSFPLLSSDRGRRKKLQIENFASLLISHMFEVCAGDTPEKKDHSDEEHYLEMNNEMFVIVDFGCGSGNLCLALAAYFKHNVKVIFIDRNCQSLHILENRAKQADLDNIEIIEYNFRPDNISDLELPAFDIGIGLHCCGSFTDMVMEICANRKASCIVCPCCNGKMTSETTGGYIYPRSKFLQHYVTQIEYLGQLSRSADDLGNYPAKCLIEYDRALWGLGSKSSVSGGRTLVCVDDGMPRFSEVKLLRLNPLESSPKHHVLYFRA